MHLIKKIIKSLDKLIFFGYIYKLYSNYLIAKNKNFLKSFSNKKIIKSNDKSNDLYKLCEKYGTDKSHPHNYTDFYFNNFNIDRNNIKLIFELGIGSTKPNIRFNMGKNGKPGASLKVWYEFFENSNIYAGDIDKDVLFESDRIKTFYVDQEDENSIKNMWEKIDKTNFDIIIDDALHTHDSAVKFFINSYNRLKTNGIYIIEDVHISYMEKLSNTLKKYNPKLILFEKNNELKDNNLLVFKKN